MKNMNDDIVTLLMIMMMLVMMMINQGGGYDDDDDNKSNIDGSLCQCCLFEEDGQVPRRPGLKRQ